MKRNATPTSAKRAVIADDFTGACDAGVQFAKQGISTSVFLTQPTLNELKKTRAALVVHDTETRNKTEKSAYRIVRRSCSLLHRSGVELVYKKIDSTLRGNLGVELQALLDVFKKRYVLLCPAYPEYQRTVINGQLLVRGNPVSKTRFAEDPANPVRSSDVKALVSFQTSEPISNIPLSTLRLGSRYVAQAMRRFEKNEIRIVCVDAENRSDLKTIASACLMCHAIPCGSAGLAEEIATSLEPVHSKVIVVSASTNEATLSELQRNARFQDTLLVRGRARSLVGKSRNGETARIRRLTLKALETHDVVLVCSALYRTDCHPELLGRLRQRRRDPITDGLASAVCPVISSGSVSSVVLTGGQMAAAFLKNIRGNLVRLHNEILPGIALGTVMSSRNAGLRVVTKAGGFGLRGSLRQIVKLLAELGETELQRRPH